jgi:hypothetical protein
MEPPSLFEHLHTVTVVAQVPGTQFTTAFFAVTHECITLRSCRLSTGSTSSSVATAFV